MSRCYMAIITCAVLALITISPVSHAGQQEKMITDFADRNTLNWYSVNDDVMGGVSKGNAKRTDDNTLLFKGNISLDNNGGFSSIMTRAKNLGLDGATAIQIRVKGDGRTYNFDMRPNTRRPWGTHRYKFKTVKDQWTVINMPIDDFKYTAFGRSVRIVPDIEPENVRSIGITLADKREGAFELEMDWIKAIKPAPAAPAAPNKTATENNIVEIASEAGSFSTLLAAAKAAGLAGALAGDGPFTVFAPTDEAFAKLPEGTVQTLLKPENKDQLIAILKLHVSPGIKTINQRELDTLNDETLTLSTNAKATINGVNIIKSDIIASNGVIHVIDQVLLPEPKTLTAREAGIKVLELAIERGAPLFNDGNPEACAAIYEVAAQSLVSNTAVMEEPAMVDLLKKALKRAQGQDDATRRAWTLRYALNDVYRYLNQ